ncbi:terminal uridylyltransferase 4 [Trichonephila clavipes]|nr:terminal uridylyltransferase 4 [Trichonephila clavipes]
MAAAQECKQIEQHIKEMIFKTKPAGEPLANCDMKPKFNHNPFSVDDKCLVTNIEKMAHLSQNPPFGERTSTSNLINQTGASELIDLNVLNDFAAKHIPDSPFNSSNMALSSNDLKLPHPDIDDCNVDIKNGDQPGIAVLLNTISKEIQNSPNFLSMPENPLPQMLGSPIKESSLTQSLDPNLPVSDSKQKDEGNDKNTQKKRKKASQKRQAKDKKMKEKTTGMSITKESFENEKKNFENKGENMRKSPAKLNQNVKAIEKGAEQSDQLPDIKAKKPIYAALGKEYSLFFQEGHFKFQCHLCSHNTDMRDNIIKHLNSKTHQSSKTQNDLDMMLPFLPGPIPHQTDAITDVLKTLALQHGLKKEDLDTRKTLSLKLKIFVETQLPNCSVQLIGSSANGFGLKNSEVDFVLNVPSHDSIPDSLENLYYLIVSDECYNDVINDFKKKRPCIKFIDRETSLHCNILIDNGSSFNLANLLSAYFQLDNRVPTLGITLRYWAKLCLIDQQDCGTLPSFCFALLLIHFLQQVQPPVLPVLHEVENFNDSIEFYDKYISSNKWKTENTDSIGELWLKFFHFYNFDYKIGENVVCVRTRKKIRCKDHNWSTKFFAVEDPFLKRNLAYVIPTFQVCHYIQQCFVRTYRYFAHPQLKYGPVKLLKTAEFDVLKISEYVPNSPLIKEEEMGDSEESENEEFDQLEINQGMEDHDPDIAVESFISTLSNMSLKDDHADEDIVPKLESSDSNLPIKQIDSSPKKTVDKTAKEINKISVQPLCYWDLKNLKITKEMFHYEFRAVTFKGEKSVPLSCKLCKGTDHQKKNCPNDVLPTPRPLPNMTLEFLDIIAKVLYYIKDKNAVSKSELDSIEADMQDVQKYIREVFPDASLKLFGSFCNGFGFKNKSDMDFCLTFGDRDDGKNLDSTDIIEKVAGALRLHSELENVVSITSAKVPIVKFSWRKTGLEGDISLYNTLALVNTELLEAYTKIDPRVQILGYALKHFAKILGICDASRGSLSSYAYILMLLYFLQQRNPPVIPVLQELPGDPKPSQLVEGWNVYFYRDLDKLKDVWPDYGKNKESIGELWLGLLSFYTCEFDWKEYVISIRQKKLLTRFKKLWSTNQLAIEDPFDLNHNLGAGLSRKMNAYILKAFIKARERFGIPKVFENPREGDEVYYLFNRNFLNSGVEPPQDRGCGNCGKIGHIARNCPQEKTCAYCRQPGHLIKNCPRKGKSKKSRERNRNNSHDNSAPERKGSHDRHNSRNMGQKINNDYITRTYPGMQQSQLMSDIIEGQKLAQMGVPAHRLPPPGFPPRNIIGNPPPGFQATIPIPPPKNYPPPFNNKHPHAASPFSRGGKQNEMHAHSPPKQFSSSPPKNFPPNKPPFHPMQDPLWPMGCRQGYPVERHPNPQLSRSLPPHPVLPTARNLQAERHLVPPGARNYPPQWQNRAFPLKDHLPHPKSNQPQNLDHRLPRTNSDNAYNSNQLDRWSHC